MARPLAFADLPPLRKEWRIVEPLFVGVGVPKAGTSWWYSMILHHSRVVGHRLYNPNVPVSKELNFFLNLGFRQASDKDRRLYKECFAAPYAHFTGEWSTQYLSNLTSISALASTLPDAKILVMLRNPIDRIQSHIQHLRTNKKKVLGISRRLTHFFDVYSVFPEVLFYSQYAQGLSNLISCFAKENILVLQYERCVANPVEQYRRTLGFLGLEHTGVDPPFTKRFNETGKPAFGEIEVDRSYLAGVLQGDVLSAARLFPSIDLTFWPDFQ